MAFIGSAAAGLVQEFIQEQPKKDAQFAKDDERPAPAEVLADEAGKESSRDGADVDTRLVNAERPRACPRAVVIADHRHGGGIIERLAQPFGRSKKEQMPKGARKSGGHTNAA